MPPTRKGLRVFVAEAGDLTVSAGWVRFPSETEFVTLWGGATLPAWRGRGIYRALVARRAKLAAERGRRYIEVDASDDSRPILERLGFVPVTTTTPYVWSPPVAADRPLSTRLLRDGGPRGHERDAGPPGNGEEEDRGSRRGPRARRRRRRH